MKMKGKFNEKEISEKTGTSHLLPFALARVPLRRTFYRLRRSLGGLGLLALPLLILDLVLDLLDRFIAQLGPRLKMPLSWGLRAENWNSP